MVDNWRHIDCDKNSSITFVYFAICDIFALWFRRETPKAKDKMIRIMVDASIKSLLSEEFGVSVQFVRAALNFKRGGDKAIAIRRAALERGGRQTDGSPDKVALSAKEYARR